jgi:hypothetical protein
MTRVSNCVPAHNWVFRKSIYEGLRLSYVMQCRHCGITRTETFSDEPGKDGSRPILRYSGRPRPSISCAERSHRKRN